jgi:hypothetical protein
MTRTANSSPLEASDCLAMLVSRRQAGAVLALVLALVTGLTTQAKAVEPVEPFLKALRQRHYFDEAFAYLESLAARPGTSDALKQTILYEKARTSAQRARGLATADARDSELSSAEKLFAQFIAEHPQHELVGAARSDMAAILVDRGRAQVERARSGDKQTRLADARKLFTEAGGLFDAAEKDLDGRVKKMPKLLGPEDTELAAQKLKLAGEMAQARLNRADVEQELAKTFEPTAPDYKKHLKSAAGRYAAVYEAYRTRSVGLWARLNEGRCHQELGETKRALGCFIELMDLPANADFRTVKTKGTRAALECWSKDGQKHGEEIVERGERWDKESPGQTDADALAIRYLVAVACEAQSKSLPAKDPNRKKLAGSARQFVTLVADHPGEYQRSAKTMLVALSAKDQKSAKGNERETFAEAFERAKQALEQMQGAAETLKQTRKSDKAAIESLEKQKKEAKEAARVALQSAINLSDSKTGADDLASAKYYLCFLAWDSGEYYDAAILGEHLVRRYADNQRGKQGAQIALASYVRLLSEPKQPNKEFLAERIRHLADDIFKRWNGQEEADEAALTLVNFSASQNNADEAIEYLKKISPNSPRRAQAELRTGQALWSAYVRALQLPAEERLPQARLDELKTKAQEVLGQGIARVEKGDTVDATAAAAAFAMAQIALDTGQPDKAIAWLENPKLGPLTLLKAGNPAVAREPFASETYKLALRAYVVVQPQQLKKAEAMMQSLDKAVAGAGDGKAADSLTAIYATLGRELQRQLEELRKNGKRQQIEAVSNAFEMILERINKRDASDFATRNWVAETTFNLAKGMDDGTSSSRAKAYFKQAAAAYARLLEMAREEPQFKEQPDRLIAMRMRLAECDMQSGEFDEATKVILAVVRDRAALVSAQTQAAEIYQARGAVDPKGYFLAIVGGEPGPDGANSIWGWSKISQMTAGRPQFAETFHQARLNMATCRYLYALTEKDSKKSKAILDAAKQDLWITYKQHPELGGEKSLAKYEGLLKKIQKSLGGKESGLEEFKQRETASTTTSAK